MHSDPAPEMAFNTGFATHVGHVRSENEDSFLTRPEIGLWAVADGMGGHEAGAFASGCVAKALATVEPARDLNALLESFLDTIGRANAEIMEFSRTTAGGTVGTTVVALLAVGRRFACAWCGDSRLYLLRGGKIEQVSRDHTEMQEFLDNGVLSPDEAANWPNRNVLTRAIGVVESPLTDSIVGELQPDDIFVLCSDGLTAHVSEQEILKAVGRRTPAGGCDDLIELALSRGGKDNVTVIVVHFKPEATRRMPAPQLGTAG